MDLCSTIVTRYALCRGQQWFGAGYHMIYAPAAYVVTFAWLYSYEEDPERIRNLKPRTFKQDLLIWALLSVLKAKAVAESVRSLAEISEASWAFSPHSSADDSAWENDESPKESVLPYATR
jgi:hypothetical protein